MIGVVALNSSVFFGVVLLKSVFVARCSMHDLSGAAFNAVLSVGYATRNLLFTIFLLFFTTTACKLSCNADATTAYVKSCFKP